MDVSKTVYSSALTLVLDFEDDFGNCFSEQTQHMSATASGSHVLQ